MVIGLWSLMMTDYHALDINQKYCTGHNNMNSMPVDMENAKIEISDEL